MSLFNTIIIAIAIVAFGSATDAIDSADVGLNANLILADSVTTSSVCNEGFVHCLDGDEVIDGAITERTCHEACEESCCSGGRGLDACDNFSGLVCKDGSCNASNGGNVCKDASIERVINSCIGRAACRNAGSNEGFVGYVVDSCQGDMACESAGSDGGKIGIIRNSCRDGDHNCVAAGAKGGMIGIIKNSCRDGNRNCVTAGGDGGIIGSINDSCQFGDRNCLGLAEEGSIGYIIRSCSGSENHPSADSCSQAGKGIDIQGIEDRARFDEIDCRSGVAYANQLNTGKSCQVACTEFGGSCCVGEDACDNFTGLVRTDGSCIGRRACYRANIGLVVNSCVGVDSCNYAGYDSDAGIGSIIENSCQGESACAFAAYEGSIDTIENSCRGVGACKYAAAEEGSIDTIENSCNNGDYNCFQVASYEGSIGHILSSCSGTAADPVNRACADVGREDDIGDILSCCNGEDEVCCQSSACSVTVTTLPEACASDPTVGIRGFARRFADE